MPNVIRTWYLHSALIEFAILAFARLCLSLVEKRIEARGRSYDQCSSFELVTCIVAYRSMFVHRAQAYVNLHRWICCAQDEGNVASFFLLAMDMHALTQLRLPRSV
mmetsp:Transcript_93662/g.147335  ORF Transcript_93662/g.147335 Transcript_93662/m.147335 type:complete len:106 (-) Transcript_93662:476-793(-)